MISPPCCVYVLGCAAFLLLSTLCTPVGLARIDDCAAHYLPELRGRFLFDKIFAFGSRSLDVPPCTFCNKAHFFSPLHFSVRPAREPSQKPFGVLTTWIIHLKLTQKPKFLKVTHLLPVSLNRYTMEMWACVSAHGLGWHSVSC